MKVNLIIFLLFLINCLCNSRPVDDPNSNITSLSVIPINTREYDKFITPPPTTTKKTIETTTRDVVPINTDMELPETTSNGSIPENTSNMTTTPTSNTEAKSENPTSQTSPIPENESECDEPTSNITTTETTTLKSVSDLSTKTEEEDGCQDDDDDDDEGNRNSTNPNEAHTEFHEQESTTPYIEDVFSNSTHKKHNKGSANNNRASLAMSILILIIFWLSNVF